jgi:hypothetical protein
VTRSILALVVVLAMAAAVSGAIRCVEVEPKVGTTQCRRAAAKLLTRDEARRIAANGGLGRG